MLPCTDSSGHGQVGMAWKFLQSAHYERPCVSEKEHHLQGNPLLLLHAVAPILPGDCRALAAHPLQHCHSRLYRLNLCCIASLHPSTHMRHKPCH